MNATDRRLSGRLKRSQVVLATFVTVVLSTALLLAEAESASADHYPYESSTSEPETSSAPSPTASPAHSPSPTTTERSHEERNGETEVQRDDLGLLGLLVVAGGGFMLTAVSVGALSVARERRRRDRASAVASETDSADV